MGENTADNMRDVHGTDELLAALADAGERLVVVDFTRDGAARAAPCTPNCARSPRRIRGGVPEGRVRRQQRNVPQHGGEGPPLLPPVPRRGGQGGVLLGVHLRRWGACGRRSRNTRRGRRAGRRGALQGRVAGRGAHFALRRPRRRLIRVCAHRARGRRSSDGDEGETARGGTPRGGRSEFFFSGPRETPFASCRV